jgi:DNA modification methylase
MVVNEDMVVLGGNMRLKALKELGYKEVPDEWVKSAKDLTDDEIRRFIIADNVGFGEHDWELLANEWDAAELADWGLDIPGFEVDEVLEAEEDDYEVPNEIETDIVLGDLFEIGEHRLLCGDSTDSEQVAKLMNGQKAELVFTDPPYGNGSSGKYGRGQLGVRTILNDDSFKCVNDFFNLRICDAYVFFLQWRTFKDALETLENNDLQLKTIAVWDKKNAGLNGAGGMSEQWEAIIVAGNIKYSRFGGNVFNISREQKKRIDSPHPHQKPIELLNDLLEYFKDYKLLVDPFSGSGSTMVAAHQLKRKCYGMELDPKYCQVIIDRMRKLDPNIVIKRNGQILEKTH